MKLSLSTGNTIQIFLIVSITFLMVHLPWNYISKKNINEITSELNREISNSISGEVDSIFDDASTTLYTIKNIFAQKIVDVNNKEEIKDLYLSLLQSHKNFSWISFGFKNGDFIGAQRVGENNLRYITSIWSERKRLASRKTDFYSISNEGKLEHEISRIKESYYHSNERSWYKRAIDSQEHIWTNVYVFNTSKKPGVNIAIALEVDGEFIGVITIALELDRISTYLEDLKVGKTGTVFIFDTNNQMIASKNRDDLVFRNVNKKLKLSLLEDSTSPKLQITHRAFKEEKIFFNRLKTTKQSIIYDGKTNQNYIVSFTAANVLDWYITTVVPENDYLYEIKQKTREIMFLIFASVALFIVLSIFLTRRFVLKPLGRINSYANHIQHFNLNSIEYNPSLVKEIDDLSKSINHMKNGLGSFKKYLPLELVRTLISEGIEAKLGGSEKDVTILFSDIVSFSKISEEIGADLIPLLSVYFGKMSDNISENNGTIDKYIGDSVMAFWGAPSANPNQASDACRAALNCQRDLKALRIDWKREGKPEFHTRIGLNTGEVVVGNIGSNEKLDYTLIGDSVNVASRLEALNKLYGTEIIIGEKTFQEAKDQIIVRKLDRVAVYGKELGVDIYELIAMRDGDSIGRDYRWIHIYEEGLTLFQKRDFENAIKKFNECIESRVEVEKASKIMITRCESLISNYEEGVLYIKEDGTYVLRSK